MKIAYLGPPASFSHKAALEAFPLPEATFHALPSFRRLFDAIQHGNSDSASSTEGDQNSNASDDKVCDFAVVPVENSTNGGVLEVLDLFIEYGLNGDCSTQSTRVVPKIGVVAEYYLQVHHCLYVHPSSMPSIPEKEEQPRQCQQQKDVSPTSQVSIETLNITTLYTHPQVWGQCNQFLTRHFTSTEARHVERVDVSSTSAAATLVAQVATQTQHPTSSSSASSTTTTSPGNVTAAGVSAAICSSLAGQQKNLSLVASNIEDSPGRNTTRFFIICPDRRRTSHLRLPEHLSVPWPPPAPVSSLAASVWDLRYVKLLVTFTVQHNAPGSLASALHVFKDHCFNLTAITTRPGKQNWHYVFFVECGMEMIFADPTASPIITTDTSAAPLTERTRRIKDLIDDLVLVTERVCYLGSWVDRQPPA